MSDTKTSCKSTNSVFGLFAAAVVAGGGFHAENAKAHGAMYEPPARHIQCYQPFKAAGDNASRVADPACRAALSESSTQSMYNRYQFSANLVSPGFLAGYYGLGNDVLLSRLKSSDTLGRINQVARMTVADGEICNAGVDAFSGFGKMRSNWKKTTINSGPQSFKFKPTAPHKPSIMQFFITKPGHDPARTPTTWNDFEPLKVYVINGEDARTGTLIDYDSERVFPGLSNNMWVFNDVSIPESREGENAILLTYWQRLDSGGEGFYNCSDVKIAGAGQTEPGSGTNQGQSQLLAGGKFVSSGFGSPNEGDSVSLKVMDSQGQEVFSELHEVSSETSSTWPLVLADKTNAYFAANGAPEIFQRDVFVGKRRADADVPGGYSYLAAESLEEMTFFSADGSFSHELELIRSSNPGTGGSGGTGGTGGSAGTGGSSSGSCSNTWDSGKAHYTGGDVVTWNGIRYKAQWWTNTEPPANQPANKWDNSWEWLGACSGATDSSGTGDNSGSSSGSDGSTETGASNSGACANTWDSSKVNYNGGDEVVLNGIRYRAQWWTNKEPPATKPPHTWSNAWMWLGSCK